VGRPFEGLKKAPEFDRSAVHLGKPKGFRIRSVKRSRKHEGKKKPSLSEREIKRKKKKKKKKTKKTEDLQRKEESKKERVELDPRTSQSSGKKTLL